MTEAGQMVMTTSGEAVELDADTIAEYLQTQFDAVWERSRAPQWYRDCVLKGAVCGWQDSLVDFDFRKKAMDLELIPALQWYKDPMNWDVGKMAYVGLDWPLDAERAKSKYGQKDGVEVPEIIAAIDRCSQTGQPQQAASASAYSDRYIGVQWMRPVVTVTTFWLRNREAPMSDQEAIAEGLVEARQVPDAVAPVMAATDSDAGNGGATDTGGEDGSIDVPAPEGGEDTAVVPDSVADVGGDAGLPQQPPMLEKLYLVATGEEVKPGDPLWPRKMVTSRTVLIGDVVVEDEIESAWDIPVVSDYNIRFGDRPYGQSECLRVAGIQMDVNALYQTKMNHAMWFKGPTNFINNLAKESLPEGGRNFFMKPGETYAVDFPTDGSKIIETVKPPELSQTIMSISQELNEVFDDSAGRPAVQQGETPTSNASGVLVETLSSNAAASASFKFQYLQEMLWRAGMLTLGCLRDPKCFTAEDFYAINRTYDIPTIEQFILPLIRTTEFKLTPEIANGAAKSQKEAQIRADFQMGLIDEETAQDKLGYDSAQIKQRKILQMQSQALAAGAVPGEPAQGPAKQLQSSGSNGNPRG